MDIHSTLKTVAPELSSELRQHLMTIGELEHYEKDELILDYGIQACFLPIILEGNARVMRGDIDDPSKELLLYLLTPGEICPCAAFSTLPKGEMPITVEAETPTVILNVPIGELNTMATNYPEWRMYELANFRKRFEELLNLVDNAIFKQLGARLRAYIEMRCRVSGHKGVALSKVKMASELGTSREVVSRLLKSLENEGVITQDKDGVHLVH